MTDSGRHEVRGREPSRTLPRTLLRSLLLTLLTFGAGVAIVLTMGVTPLAAVIFALACAVAGLISSLV
jgi:hypothetical protein